MIKKLQQVLLLILLLASAKLSIAQNVGIRSTDATPAISAMLDVSSTTKGFLTPRMWASERIAISLPAARLLVYQTDAPAGYYYYNGTAWVVISFKISAPPSIGMVTDNDGNTYNYFTIGTQTWMVENLKTTKYRNGDLISNVTDNAAWSALAIGAFCWYNNDAAQYKAVYSALYNWYAVADSRNIAPTGWHVPTDAEWTTLTTFLGGESVAGDKLKESGLAWYGSNTSTNSNGFTAFPGGYRSYSGTF